MKSTTSVLPSPGNPVETSVNEASDDSIRSRIKDALDNRAKNKIQRHALELAYQGFYPIPVAGIVRNEETGELECSCQSYKRRTAERNDETVEICGAPGKHPTAKNWQARATRDPDKIMHLFATENNFKRTSFDKGMNIGLVTSPHTGLAVLDIDGADGAANLEKLVAAHGQLPDTVTAITGSGGRHYYFRQPDGITIQNSASKIAPKIDFRADRGQVLAPPSKHKSGGSYQWEERHSPADLQLADMPAWLIKLAVEGGEHEAPAKPVKAMKAPRRERARDESKSNRSGGRNTHRADEVGWQRFLSDVGDDEGKHGFNDPIGRAILSYVKTEGVTADPEPLLDAIGEAVDSAEKDPAKHRGKYQRGSSYLTDQIDGARVKVRDEARQAAEDQAEALDEADALIAEIRKTKEWSADGVTELLRKLIHAKPLEVAQRFSALTRLKIGGLTKDLLTGELNRLRAEIGGEDEGETDSSIFSKFRDSAEQLNTYVASVLFPGSHKIVVQTARGPRFLSYNDAKTWLAKVKHKEAGESVQTFPDWMEWGGRPDYIGTDFNPGGSDPDLYNMWQGFTTQPTAGDWERIRQHIFCILCAGDVEAFEYAIGWLAQLLQEPHNLIGTSWLVVGEEGSGKGSFFDMLRFAIGVHATEASGEDDLFNDFNELQANKVLIVADESPVSAKESQNERMRNNITSPTMRHTKKGVDKVEVRNCRHWVFTLNPKRHKVQVAIDDKSRRFFITITDESRNRCISYFKTFAASADAGGREAMFHDLMRYQCDFDVLRNPYRSAAFGVMAERNFAPEIKWWREILMGGVLPGTRSRNDWEAECAVTRKAMRESYNNWRTERDLHSLDEVTAGYVFRGLLPFTAKTKIDTDHAYKLPCREDCRVMFAEKYRVPVDPDAEDARGEAITFPHRREEIDKDGNATGYWLEDPFEATGFNLLYAGTIDRFWPVSDGTEARLHRHIDALNESAQPSNWPCEGSLWRSPQPNEEGEWSYVSRYPRESERPFW